MITEYLDKTLHLNSHKISTQKLMAISTSLKKEKSD